jgi:hypothetical protein
MSTTSTGIVDMKHESTQHKHVLGILQYIEMFNYMLHFTSLSIADTRCTAQRRSPSGATSKNSLSPDSALALYSTSLTAGAFSLATSSSSRHASLVSGLPSCSAVYNGSSRGDIWYVLVSTAC